MITTTTPEEVNAYRMLAIKGALKGRGPSALSVVKKEFGIKARTAREALPLYIEFLKGKGILAR